MKGQKWFWLDIIIGIVLLIVSFKLADDYYTTLVMAMGIGLIAAGAVNLAKSYYWQQPKRKMEYERKKEEAHINAIDERKAFLRAKAGQMAYQIMFFLLLFISFLLAVLRAEAWVIAMMYGLWLFQWLLGVVIFRRLEKRL